MSIIGKRFTRLGTMVAAFRTAFSHDCGERSATRTNLGTGGTAGSTVPTVHQARQVFLLAIDQQVRTVGGTVVACTLAIGASFGTVLQLRIDLYFRRLHLMREHIAAGNGKCKRQRHHTDSTKHSILHNNSLSKKTVIWPATEIAVRHR
jgi:hypothetical protein